ncbi:hypothetical protein CMV_024702 [Castanea mollissima]|uniref:Pentatricopeptide repeat-containing protein n=1 Tax=Castanea mollissima TaxID=60419 RepID=A0A8J4VHP7_9ROSI|nr:hypothetical protein CMV_024702 [Castanea mollissima]
MRYEYSLLPSPDHYACMVDLLSKVGRLKAAYELINSMLMEPHAGAWGALLGACKLHCNIELGLYQSSSLSSESHWQLGNLPSLPHPPTFDQPIYAHDSKAPLVFSGDLDNLYHEKNSELSLTMEKIHGLKSDLFDLKRRGYSKGCIEAYAY